MKRRYETIAAIYLQSHSENIDKQKTVQNEKKKKQKI